MNDNDSPLVSIVITTRNRKAELSRALSSCSQLSGIPFEVLVYDDASTDGTAEEVETRFPWVRLVRSEEHAERVLLRNRAFREAKGQFVLTIDDDCYSPTRVHLRLSFAPSSSTRRPASWLCR